MALFQTSVLKSHLAQLDVTAVDKAYKKYQKYFWNTTIQENIKMAKEEQYQATFLNELFVNILGYTLFPNPNSNLTTEFKNEKNAGKADGAILKEGAAIGVIELKGTNTKDLESIRRQAFDYKANQKKCVYIITSNFEKLRFYINDATEFEEFDLFTLSRKQFNLLYLCLHVDELFNNTPLKIKEASIAEEEEITKAFYKDYSVFKRELYRDLVKNNAKTLKEKLAVASANSFTDQGPGADNTADAKNLTSLEKNVKLTLFKKSQKLIDRFLFIFFAEDRMLLPSNSTLQILNKWKADWDFGDERSLYQLFKQYFNFLDTGRKGTENRAEIYAYNGGLFKTDSILDALEIDNDLLYKHTLKLSNYDFESQVDVNILGHIFENSLNEIESVSAEIEGGNFDKQTSKRKKDGVFYTPKYITKYIVENTVGKLCEEKKAALGFDEEQYFRGRKNRNKETILNLVQILDDYREWLLQLTICDPACGSGAFLNQALDFLIKEHSYIDELKTKILGGGLQFPDIENTILENNIYGVDLNEESVEIAKLSLWLRTAQPRRKLNDLSNNIKCGNSLIDDKKVAGDKAFKWESAFAKVFSQGGFDVVIGNPPYVSSKGQNFNDNEKEFFNKNFKCASYQIDLYLLFNELSYDLLKVDGIVSFIEPNAWLNNLYLSGIREYLLKHFCFIEIVDTPNGVFKDATVDTLIAFWRKSMSRNDKIILSKVFNYNIENYEFLDQNEALKNDKFLINIYSASNSIDILQKIEKDAVILNDLCNSTSGIKEYEFGKGTPPQSRETLKLKPFNTKEQLDENHQKHLSGIDLERYVINWQGNYLNYGSWIAAPRDESYFKGPRIIIREIPGKTSLIVSYTEDQFTVKNTAHTFKLLDNYLKYYKPVLAILNSKCMGYYFKNKFAEFDDVFPKAKIGQCKELPINLNISDTRLVHWNLIVERHVLNLKLELELINRFSSYISSSINLIKLSRKLESWYKLSFVDFLKELNKAIKDTNKIRSKENQPQIPTLTKLDEMDWMEAFEVKKKETQELQTQIQQTEKQIDQMVYELYGLTEEEIAIVEKN